MMFSRSSNQNWSSSLFRPQRDTSKDHATFPAMALDLKHGKLNLSCHFEFSTMDLLPLVASPPVWLQHHTFLLPAPVWGDEFKGDGGIAPPKGINLKPEVVDDLIASGPTESGLVHCRVQTPSCFEPIHLNQLCSCVKAMGSKDETSNKIYYLSIYLSIFLMRAFRSWNK